MYEDDVDYASKRLDGTLVRLNNGEPFYVHSSFTDDDDRLKHRGTVLPDGKVREVFHGELDLEPVPLGFANIERSMVYIMRKPMRRDWHQGLTHNSIATCGTVSPERVQMSWLVQPIKQQYPSFLRAIQDLGKRDAIAFSREFGLSRDGKSITLHYRNYKVGEVLQERAVLAPNRIFLQQHLEEAVGA